MNMKMAQLALKQKLIIRMLELKKLLVKNMSKIKILKTNGRINRTNLS